MLDLLSGNTATEQGSFGAGLAGTATDFSVPRETIQRFSEGQSSTLPPTFSPTFDGKRTIPSPEVTNLMLEMLCLQPHDKLLEIGTGSGYQTNVFAETGAEIHTIELEPWVDSTKITGDYVFLHSGDGINGLPNHAPFSAIAVTCAIERIPRAWIEQLSEGGRLVAPIGDSVSQRLTLLRKEKGDVIPIRIAAYVRFSMMREKPEPKPPKYQPYGAQS